ncbi:uncharacterized protein BDV14DRAFT_168260 [Aspergillus stella-maris]|uniref:uncharacterized protein n=1 Tax=Aspergillus stella-maris TaxID=1810926 RepID=UPI003CCE5102
MVRWDWSSSLILLPLISLSRYHHTSLQPWSTLDYLLNRLCMQPRGSVERRDSDVICSSKHALITGLDLPLQFCKEWV